MRSADYCWQFGTCCRPTPPYAGGNGRTGSIIKHRCIVLLSCLSGCAAVVSGTTDVVSVSSSPPGTNCSVARSGSVIGIVTATPGMTSVAKRGSPFQVTCSKPGCHIATAVAPSSFSGWTFRTLVVDASPGTNFSNPSRVDVALASKPAELPTANLVTARMMALPPRTRFLRNLLEVGARRRKRQPNRLLPERCLVCRPDSLQPHHRFRPTGRNDQHQPRRFLRHAPVRRAPAPCTRQHR